MTVTVQEALVHKVRVDAERIRFNDWWANQGKVHYDNRTEWEKVIIQATAWRGWLAAKGLIG